VSMFTVENQGSNSYLVYEVQPEDMLDTMSLGMLTNNAIPGFAAVSVTQMNSTKFIKYKISAYVSAAKLFEGIVTKRKLLSVFHGIVKAVLTAEDYMIDPAGIQLDLNSVFVDVNSLETAVICVPVVKENGKMPDLSMFFKNIIFTAQYDPTEDASHVTKILNYLNGTPVLSLPDFKGMLEKLLSGLPVEEPKRPYLIRKCNGQKVLINKSPFHIGKDAKYADYCIADNNAISRKHADIITQGNVYFVKDTMSTNCTYVNGEEIAREQEVQIQHGTVISFANEDFVFELR